MRSMRRNLAPPTASIVALVPATMLPPSARSASGRIPTRAWSVSTAYRFCAFMFWPTGTVMSFLAEMARSAKQTLERRPETSEMVEKDTSFAEAIATPAEKGRRRSEAQGGHSGIMPLADVGAV